MLLNKSFPERASGCCSGKSSACVRGRDFHENIFAPLIPPASENSIRGNHNLRELSQRLLNPWEYRFSPELILKRHECTKSSQSEADKGSIFVSSIPSSIIRGSYEIFIFNIICKCHSASEGREKSFPNSACEEIFNIKMKINFGRSMMALWNLFHCVFLLFILRP